MLADSILTPPTPPGVELADAGASPEDVDAALARYRAMAAELAEAQSQHPEVALALARLDFDTYLGAAIELVDHLAAERDEALACNVELEAALASAERENKALRWCTGARERHIVRLEAEVRDLRRRLPRHEQYVLTSAEAFIASHPIADVVGRVVDVHPHENGHRRYLAGQCPFHAEDHPSPSLVVHPYHGQFACYVCGAAGTVVDFLKRLRDRGEVA